MRFCSLFALGVLIPIQAQEAIVLGEPLSFPLEVEHQRVFAVTAETKGWISAYALSSELDTALEVVDANGGRITSDDEGGRPTPHLWVVVDPGDTVSIIVRARVLPIETPVARGEVALHTKFSPFSAEVKDSTAAIQAKTEQLALRARDPGTDMSELIPEAAVAIRALWTELREAPDTSRSRGAAFAAELLGHYALHIAQDWELSLEAYGLARGFSEAFYPPDHPDLLRPLQGEANALLASQRQELMARAISSTSRLVAASTRIHSARSQPAFDYRNSHASALLAAGHESEALEVLLDLCSHLDEFQVDEYRRGLALYSLCRAHHALDQPDQARRASELALERLRTALPDGHPTLRAVRTTLAALAVDSADAGEGLLVLEQELQWAERTLPEGHANLLTLRFNVAVLAHQLGDSVVARGHLERALGQARAQLEPDDPFLLRIQSALGRTLRALGEREVALELQQEVLERLSASRQPGDHDLETARVSVASLLQDSHRLPEAMKLLLQVEEELVAKVGEDNAEVSVVRSNLASVMMALGRTADAIRIAESLVQWAERELPPGHRERLRLVNELCTARGALPDPSGLPADLERLGQEFLQHLSLIAADATPRRSMAAVANARYAVDQFLDLCFSLKGDAGARLRRTAFELVEAARSPQTTHARLIGLLASPAAANDSELQRLRREAAGAAGRLTVVARRFGATGALMSAEPELFDAELRKELIQRALFDRLRALPGAEAELGPIDLARTARSLGSTTVAIGYWRHPIRMHTTERSSSKQASEIVEVFSAFVLRHDGDLRWIRLAPAAEIEAAVMAWRVALGVDSVDVSRGLGLTPRLHTGQGANELAMRLRSFLLDPLAEHLQGIESIVVALDDALHLVPLDVLPFGEGGELLGDRCGVRVVSRLRDLGIPLARETQAEASLFVLGDLEFGSSGDRQDASLAPLPGTAKEIDAVGKLFEARYGSTARRVDLRGAAATKGSVVAALTEGSIVHLATHGWLRRLGSDARERGDSRQVSLRDVGHDPSQLTALSDCGLALSGANQDLGGGGDTAPGLLSGEEIAALDLSHVDLVVVSACESMLGLRTTGQGVASLQRAFEAAGARTAVTSLWKVPDTPTVELMESFYSRLLNDGATPEQALWKAKAALRAQRLPTRDWAGWVVSGAPR